MHHAEKAVVRDFNRARFRLFRMPRFPIKTRWAA